MQPEWMQVFVSDMGIHRDLEDFQLSIACYKDMIYHAHKKKMEDGQLGKGSFEG